MIELRIEEQPHTSNGAALKVIGIGGAGGNAVNSMIQGEGLEHVVFIAANTDSQALKTSAAQHTIQLGLKITKGLGAGSNPEIGRRAAEEDLEAITHHLEDTDILFLTAGLGGGTGSGALPVIAGLAKEHGILTVAIVTLPFLFEGKRRLKHAEDAIANLKGIVDTLIVVPNQKLLELADPKISMLNAFALSNNILEQAIKGISDIITKTGHINVDFADVKVIMKDMGMAILGTGKASGEDRARQAALNAISSPLLENISITGARGILINITGTSDIGLQEINDAASLISEMVNPDANIILGSVIDESMNNEIMVTIIATGFEDQSHKPKASCYAKQEVLKETKNLSLDQERREQELQKQKNEVIILEAPKKQNTYVAAACQNNNITESSLDLEDLDTPTFLRKKTEESVSHKN